VTIDGGNKRASIIAVGGAEFEVNDGGIFPVQQSPTAGRRLLFQVRRPHSRESRQRSETPGEVASC
jgi:hypothetical protein